MIWYDAICQLDLIVKYHCYETTSSVWLSKFWFENSFADLKTRMQKCNIDWTARKAKWITRKLLCIELWDLLII